MNKDDWAAVKAEMEAVTKTREAPLGRWQKPTGDELEAAERLYRYFRRKAEQLKVQAK